MSWWEVLISVPVLALAGVAAGVFTYRWEELRHGRIKVERDEFNAAAMAIGVDVDEARSMGLMCAASGMRREDVERMVREWASGDSSGGCEAAR